MKSPYRIEAESYTYTYRSYMACEDNGPADCVGTRNRWVVYRGNRKLKSHYSRSSAQEYVRRLLRKSKIRGGK